MNEKHYEVAIIGGISGAALFFELSEIFRCKQYLFTLKNMKILTFNSKVQVTLKLFTLVILKLTILLIKQKLQKEQQE